MQAGFASAIGAARRGDVLVLTLSGVVTKQTYEAALGRVWVEVRDGSLRALVIDMTDTGRLMTADEWEDGLRASEHLCLTSHVPCGLVVSAGMLLQMRRECSRVSSLGITWAVFLHLEDAFQWAATWSEPLPERAPPPRSLSAHPTPQLLH